MKVITATRDPNGGSCIMNIEIDEILMLRYSRTHDKVEVHTINDMLYTVGTLKYWCGALNASGLNFASVDRSNILNLNKVIMLDETFKVAYFETEVNSQSKRCLIADYKYKDLKKRLALSNPLIVLT